MINPPGAELDLQSNVPFPGVQEDGSHVGSVRLGLVLVDDIRDALEQGHMGHTVPGKMPLDEPAIARGGFERHDLTSAADQLRQRQRHGSLEGADVPYGFAGADDSRKDLNMIPHEGVQSNDTATAYDKPSHAVYDMRATTMGTPRVILCPASQMAKGSCIEAL